MYTSFLQGYRFNLNENTGQTYWLTFPHTYQPQMIFSASALVTLECHTGTQ